MRDKEIIVMIGPPKSTENLKRRLSAQALRAKLLKHPYKYVGVEATVSRLRVCPSPTVSVSFVVTSKLRFVVVTSNDISRLIGIIYHAANEMLLEQARSFRDRFVATDGNGRCQLRDPLAGYGPGAVSPDDGARLRSAMARIRSVLLEEWDPIGVRDEPRAQDEYDSYVTGIYALLAAHAPGREIADYLHKIETIRMGLRGQAEAKLLKVAELLEATQICI
jgi:hypothetical protein